jgi:hypothetical protein
MTTKLRRSRWAGTIAVAAALLVLGAPPVRADDPGLQVETQSATVTDAEAPAWKQDFLTLHNKLAAGTMTADDVAAYNAIVDAHAPSAVPQLSASSAVPAGGIAPMSLYTSKNVARTQYPEEKNYWCGPATAKSIVVAWSQVDPIFHPDTTSHLDGKSLSQTHLAGPDYTTAEVAPDYSTDWYPKDMQTALNNWLFGQATGEYVEYTPSSASALSQHVTADIDVDWMIAADTKEHVGGPHFNHHPNHDIWHWTSIRGYESSGATDHYQDPGANAGISGWGSVNPYFSMTPQDGYSYMTQQGSTFGIVW